MYLEEIASRSRKNKRRDAGQKRSPSAKSRGSDPQRARYERILRGVFNNEKRLKLLSDLMFLVVSASLRDDLIGQAAKLKHAVSTPTS